MGKNVLRALNGIAKLLKVDTPKNWVVEDRNGFKDVLLMRDGTPGKDGRCGGEGAVDLIDVLTNGQKLCRHCDSDCYFKYAVGRTNQRTAKVEVSSIEQLKEMQERHRVDQEKRLKRERSGSGGEVGVPNG